jgi:hypothetical protein
MSSVSRSEVTKRVTAAVCTYLRTQGLKPLTEYVLPNGRRLDVAALGANGSLAGVEVKVAESDFNRDWKWADAAAQCFLFYFAVPMGFDVSIIHPGIRVMMVEGDHCWLHRKTGKGLIAPARYNTVTGRYAVKPDTPALDLRSRPLGDCARRHGLIVP